LAVSFIEFKNQDKTVYLSTINVSKLNYGWKNATCVVELGVQMRRFLGSRICRLMESQIVEY